MPRSSHPLTVSEKALDLRRELASALAARRRRIAASWSRRLAAAGHQSSWPAGTGELDRWAEAGVDALIATLGSPGARHLGERLVAGSARSTGSASELAAAIEATLLLREAAAEELTAAAKGGVDRADPLLATLDESVRRVLADVVGRQGDSPRQSLEEQRLRTALMLQAAEAAGSSLDLDVVLPRVAGVIQKALDAAACGLFLWSPAEGRFEPRAVGGAAAAEAIRILFSRQLTPQRDPLVARALERRGPVTCTVAERGFVLGDAGCAELGITSAVALPILLADRVLGLALAVHCSARHGFLPRQLDVAWSVTNAVAPAVDNARRYAEARSRLEEGRRLNRATAALLEMQGLEDVLTIICRESRVLVASEASAVLLEEEVAGRPAAMAQGIDLERARALAREGGAEGGAITIPLRLKGRVLGVLVVAAESGRFSKGELGLLAQFADKAAMAIEHALLHAKHEQLAALEERQKLAHELHDSVTQSLYGVALYGEAAARFLASGEVARAETLLQELRDTSLEALREMRLLVFELRPPLMEREGLVAALQARLAAVEGRAGLETELVTRNADAVPSKVAGALYGICKEALNNVLKHSAASRVLVRLEREGPWAELEIRDDGSGFDLAEARLKGGMGLAVMEERTARLGGRLTVSSRRGEGTSVTVRVPVESLSRLPE